MIFGEKIIPFCRSLLNTSINRSAKTRIFLTLFQVVGIVTAGLYTRPIIDVEMTVLTKGHIIAEYCLLLKVSIDRLKTRSLSGARNRGRSLRHHFLTIMPFNHNAF
jgi:hypothetical protein